MTETRPQSPGHEYQMIDDTGYPGKLGPNQRTADFYDVLPAGPTSRSGRPASGNNADRRPGTPRRALAEWQARAHLRARERCGQGRDQKSNQGHPGSRQIAGHIMLTYHQDECWYRNLKIRETSEAATAPHPAVSEAV